MRKRIFHSRPNETQYEEKTRIPGIIIELRGSDLALTDLQHGVNESYEMVVPVAGAVHISASTEWGALRGIETFAQSVNLVAGTDHGWFKLPQPTYVFGLWPPTRVVDRPRTAWRGLLIDTSRHFLSVPTIQRTIQAMSMAKLNVLHWHIVDGDGWPLCLNSTLRVCQKAAYRDPWGELFAYQPSDLRSIVAFAHARGVRVVPEFDLPGHIAAPLCSAEPQLCISGCAPDPSNEAWWTYLGTVVDELTAIFPERFFHGGGDEFHPDCWFANATLKAWSLHRGLNTSTALLDHFYTRWQQLLLGASRRPMFWDEFFWVYGAPMPTRSTMTVLPGTTASVRGVSGDAGALIKSEYDEDRAEWEATLAAGIPAVNTGISEMWYLDRVGKLCANQPGGRDPTAPSASYFWQAWRPYHDHDPFSMLNASCMTRTELMLGGEVNMWGEGVDDTNFEPHVFPSTSAAAERLWSFQPTSDLPNTQERLAAHRCALVRAGVRASPIGPGPPAC
jgi:hexosaminidase